MKSFVSVVGDLTAHDRFRLALQSPADLVRRTRDLFVVSLVLMALYGSLIGAFGGPLQALSSAIKLPLLFLATALICYPTLYILSQFAGSKATAAQFVALVQAAIAVAALILCAFAPISAFFLMTSSNYSFFKLLNVGILGFAAIMGVRFLFTNALALSADEPNRDARRRILTLWIVLFAFVGSQLGWTLRPFFGAPDMKFEVVRELGGNFYTDVAKSVGEIFQVDEPAVAKLDGAD